MKWLVAIVIVIFYGGSQALAVLPMFRNGYNYSPKQKVPISGTLNSCSV